MVPTSEEGAWLANANRIRPGLARLKVCSILPVDDLYIPDDGRRAPGGLSEVVTCRLQVEVVPTGIDMLTWPRKSVRQDKENIT